MNALKYNCVLGVNNKRRLTIHVHMQHENTNLTNYHFT